MKVTGTVKSEKGFYIGDLCYAVSTNVYDNIWGKAGYDDGIFTEPVTGYKFAVAETTYGDGAYEDQNGRIYGVDAGNISLVPAELAEATDGGYFFAGAGEATFEAEAGEFLITLPNGEAIHIDTDESWEDDYYENEDEEYYEEDDEPEEDGYEEEEYFETELE